MDKLNFGRTGVTNNNFITLLAGPGQRKQVIMTDNTETERGEN